MSTKKALHSKVLRIGTFEYEKIVCGSKVTRIDILNAKKCSTIKKFLE